jgi:hypothetical protein
MGMHHALIPELDDLEQILELGRHHLEVNATPSTPAGSTASLPIYRIALGNPSSDVPAAAFVAGVHGLERIGSQVVLAFLRGLVTRLAWDTTLHAQLETMRLVFMPVVNPGGMLRGTRANPNGVDLMRNSPVEALDRVPLLVGGQCISPGLPWYRGRRGEPMEIESLALCELVEGELHGRPFSLVLDCHSGFGMRDRLWFPYAHQRTPIPHLAQLHALHEIFQQSNTHHPYVFEPQSTQYLAHGDLWDHLYLQALPQGSVFLPLTLEMGSWLWVKKNPRQLFSLRGLFNPLIAHREQRVLRRHLPLLDFIMRAAAGWDRWLPREEDVARHRAHAMARWYGAG